MASNSAQDWMNQWQALAQRYWDGWKAQGLGPAAAGRPDANAPWQAALDQWTQLFGQGAQQSDLVDRVAANAKSYVGLMQSLLNTALGQQGGGSAMAWAEALRNGFNVPGMDPALWNNPLGAGFRDLAGQGAKGFEQLMAEFGRGATGALRQEVLANLGMPAFGLAREHQERWQQLGAALVDYQEQTNRYNALILQASQQGFDRFQSKLAEREEPGRQLDSVRAVYDLWIDAAEEAYADIALSDEFRKAYGAMVNAQMRVRSLLQTEVEQQTRQLGMPTRSELKGVEKSLQELRRHLKAQQESSAADLSGEVAALRTEIAALKRELAGAKPAAAKPAAPAKPAATSKKTKR